MNKILFPSLLAALLVGCVEPSSSLLSSLTSTTSFPNGNVPLVPIEGCLEPLVDEHWVCSWSDEFDGETLDTANWNIEVNGDGGGNQELQYYRAENIAVTEGNLVITAKKENYAGKSYTSGRINSKYRANLKYGRVRFSAKMPGGRGTWGAIWMLPVFNVYGGWPQSGEIDIVEYVGYEPNKVYAATHTERFNHNLGNNPRGFTTIEDAENAFHVFDLIWMPGTLRMLVDGETYGQFNYVPQFTSQYPYEEVFPFDQEFFMVINLAIGGSWGGVQGVDTTAFPTTLEMQYLRFYQFDYALVDTGIPSTPTNLALATYPDTIHWNRAIDDTDVAGYEIFVDGAYYRTTSVNQFTFKTLVDDTDYTVQVRAIDFTGQVSELSESLLFHFVG